MSKIYWNSLEYKLTEYRLHGTVNSIDPITAKRLNQKMVCLVPILCLTTPDKMHEHIAPSDIDPTTKPNSLFDIQNL